STRHESRLAHFRVRFLCVIVVISLVSNALPTRAQTGALEEIIVTASKRPVNLQDVPITVTAFSDQVIQEAGINDATDLAILTPALTITVNTQPFTAAFRIRGIGTSQSDIALEPSVGIFVDDVYLNRSGLGMSDLTDIERIEILHGPQGTLYGKNTNAGAISIFTKLPNLEEFEGYVQTDIGNYDLRKITAAVSGPVSDTLGYRISGTYHERDGYYENAAGDDPNSADDWNVIAKVLWQPTSELSFLLKGSRLERDTQCCAADAVQSQSVNDELAARGLPADDNDPFDYDIAVDVANEFEQEADSLSLLIDYELSFGSFKSITAWGQSDGSTTYDVDRSLLDVMSYVDAVSSGSAWSQEFRFSSEWGENLDYQLGLFYYESRTKGNDGDAFVFLGEDVVLLGEQQEDFLDPLPPGTPNVAFVAQPGDSLRARTILETENYAVFGQSTYHISDVWRVTGGLRWTYEEKYADLLVAIDSTALSGQLFGSSFLTTVSTPIDDDFTRDTDDINWLLSTSYDLREDTMVFASVATGSKSGGFNTVNGTPEQREFDDEGTISYELGIKSTALDARLRLNASLFYTEIDDYQFQEQIESGVGTIVSNEAGVEVSGLDMDVQALPLPNLTLTAGLLYLHKYEITDGPNKGENLRFTPEYSGNLSATWVFPLADGGIFLRADYSYMDDHVTASGIDFSERDIQDRNEVNARVGWRNEQWNLALWGKNLTNNEYAGLTAATFPVTTMDAYFLAPPRTWGVTLRLDY
ncbi:MAG: TonB-dependent receptor, partial [Pseudomonadota bacterium]